MFPESSNSQNEREASLSVETSMPKLFILVTSYSKHEWCKKFCTFCNKKQPSGHLCYVDPLIPSKLSNKYLYVFFDTECTQDLEKCYGSFEHVPNLMCSADVF